MCHETSILYPHDACPARCKLIRTEAASPFTTCICHLPALQAQEEENAPLRRGGPEVRRVRQATDTAARFAMASKQQNALDISRNEVREPDHVAAHGLQASPETVHRKKNNNKPL